MGLVFWYIIIFCFLLFIFLIFEKGVVIWFGCIDYVIILYYVFYLYCFCFNFNVNFFSFRVLVIFFVYLCCVIEEGRGLDVLVYFFFCRLCLMG